MLCVIKYDCSNEAFGLYDKLKEAFTSFEEAINCDLKTTVFRLQVECTQEFREWLTPWSISDWVWSVFTIESPGNLRLQILSSTVTNSLLNEYLYQTNITDGRWLHFYPYFRQGPNAFNFMQWILTINLYVRSQLVAHTKLFFQCEISRLRWLNLQPIRVIPYKTRTVPCAKKKRRYTESHTLPSLVSLTVITLTNNNSQLIRWG